MNVSSELTVLENKLLWRTPLSKSVRANLMVVATTILRVTGREAVKVGALGLFQACAWVQCLCEF